MSDKPNEECINELRTLLWLMQSTKRHIEELRQTIKTSHDALESELQVYGNARLRVFELMRSMNVAQSGNAGWEGRMTYFLEELVGHAPTA